MTSQDWNDLPDPAVDNKGVEGVVNQYLQTKRERTTQLRTNNATANKLQLLTNNATANKQRNCERRTQPQTSNVTAKNNLTAIEQRNCERSLAVALFLCNCVVRSRLHCSIDVGVVRLRLRCLFRNELVVCGCVAHIRERKRLFVCFVCDYT